MENIEIIELYADMGSCQCGDVNVVATIDHDKKTFSTECRNQSHKWMHGKIVGGEFSIPYVSQKILVPKDYKVTID
jgi:hypothetical protein